MDDAPPPSERPSTGRLHPVKVYGGTAKAAVAPRKASPVLAGILVGIPAAGVWALVAYVTGYEIGWVAWGVGALIGLAVAKSAHEPNASLGATAHESFSPELQAAIQGVRERSVGSDQRESLQGRMQAEALARAAAATQVERERVVRASAEGILKTMGFFAALKELFRFWDVLWMFLAVSSAFKVAQGRSS